MASDWLTIAAAVNDDEILARNLARSPAIGHEGFRLIEQRGFSSASRAYNDVLDGAQTPWIAFVHQDVYLPHTWADRLHAACTAQEVDNTPLGVLGVFGVDAQGDHLGRVWSSGLGRELDYHVNALTAAVSLDELVLVVRTDCDLRFDDALPGFHLYGTDIALRAHERGLAVCVFDGPVIHNSRPVRTLDASYEAAYRHVATRWERALPVPTCIIPIEADGTALKRWRRKRAMRRWRDRMLCRKGSEVPASSVDAAERAQQLGYESCHAEARTSA